MNVNELLDEIRDEIPGECDLTLDHAMTHLRSAAECAGDPEQVAHDISMAGRILICLYLFGQGSLAARRQHILARSLRQSGARPDG